LNTVTEKRNFLKQVLEEQWSKEDKVKQVEEGVNNTKNKSSKEKKFAQDSGMISIAVKNRDSTVTQV
jgi:hypothetical protein